MRVEAIKTGFANGSRQRAGSRFSIPDEPTREIKESEKEAAKKLDIKGKTVPRDFSFAWMIPVDEKAEAAEAKVEAKADAAEAKRDAKDARASDRKVI